MSSSRSTTPSTTSPASSGQRDYRLFSRSYRHSIGRMGARPPEPYRPSRTARATRSLRLAQQLPEGSAEREAALDRHWAEFVTPGIRAMHPATEAAASCRVRSGTPGGQDSTSGEPGGSSLTG